MVAEKAPRAKRVRILIYSANFAPEPTGVGKYSGEMAAWLAGEGHEVRVIAAPPYYPAWRIDRGYRWPPFRRENYAGADVWRAPIWVPKSPGGIKRTLHLLSFALTSFPLVMMQLPWRPDVVLTVAPAFMCAPAGLLAASLTGAKSWLHLQDFEIDVAFRMGLLKGKLLQRVALRMESWILRRFDTVSTISSRMMERLLMKGVAPKRICYFPNWVDISSATVLRSPQRYRAELGIPRGAVVALFSGTLGGKQGLMVIPSAASLLESRADIVFVVCGDGVMKPGLEAAGAGLSNFHLIPLQPEERLRELLGMADLHLMPQSPDAADLVLPSKLSGMLARARAASWSRRTTRWAFRTRLPRSPTMWHFVATWAAGRARLPKRDSSAIPRYGVCSGRSIRARMWPRMQWSIERRELMAPSAHLIR